MIFVQDSFILYFKMEMLDLVFQVCGSVSRYSMKNLCAISWCFDVYLFVRILVFHF